MKFEVKINSINPPTYIIPTDEQIRGAEPMPRVPEETRELVYTRLIETKSIGDVMKAIEDSK
jgi:hypothetical protein